MSYRFEDIVRSDGGYGIKLDIEGSEHELGDSPEIVRGASWIIGELHYGAFLRRTPRRGLESLLEQYFTVEFSAPIASDDRTNRRFKAFRSLEPLEYWPPWPVKPK